MIEHSKNKPKRQYCGRFKCKRRGSINGDQAAFVCYALVEQRLPKSVVSPYGAVAFKCADSFFSFIAST